MAAWTKSIHSYWQRVYRVLVNIAGGFIQNEDYLKASALTFYTLMSIVPFASVTFGIATGFGLQRYLEKELFTLFEEQKEAMQYVIQFAHSLLLSAQSGVVAGVGLITLFWTSFSMLGSIEQAINDIWKVKKPRTWYKRATNYLAVMILCPIFLVISSSLSVFVLTQITETAKANPILELVSPYLLVAFRIIPVLLSILLFTIIYLFIPNVKMQPVPRIVAGIIAGIAFQLWQWLYIKFQVDIAHYDAIYGTLAALPLFLIWLQISWLIVLAGAEIAAQMENELSYGALPASNGHRVVSQRELGLLIVRHCIHAFSVGEHPPTALQIARELGAPLLTTQQMLDILEEGEILVEVGGRRTPHIGYQPSRDVRLFTVKEVCDVIEKHTDWSITVRSSSVVNEIVKYLQEFERIMENSSANVSLDKLEYIPTKS